MTSQPPLIPRQPRQMKQPRKEMLRDAVVALTAENIRLREENAAAAAHYTAALALPVASAQERTRLEERLRECNLAAASR